MENCIYKNHRDFFTRLTAAGAALWVAPARAQQAPQPAAPFETPDLPKLLPRIVDGVKEFRLIGEPVRTQFLPGRSVDGWGFNRTPRWRPMKAIGCG